MRRAIVGVAMITAFGMPAGAGCKSHDQLVLDTICPQVCRCFDPEFPDECERACRLDADPDTVSGDCFDCFLEARDDQTCRSVERCNAICERSAPQVDAPPFVDAPFFPGASR